MKIDISQTESDEKFNDIIFDYVESKKLSVLNNPKGIILGGQPGSGKSYLKEEVIQEFNENFIFISTDDLRLYHPAYETLQQSPETVQNAANLVNPYASAWTKKLIKYCIENKYNLIIDSTLGGDIQANYDTIEMFINNGYQVHFRVMAVPSIISKLSIFLRYETQLAKEGFARWTRMEDHKDRFENLETNLLHLISRYELSSLKFYERVFDDYKTIGMECVESLSKKEIKKWTGFENNREFKLNNFPYLINTINKLSNIIVETERNKRDFETFVQKDVSSFVGLEDEVQKFNSYIIELVKFKETTAIIDNPNGIQEFSNDLKYTDLK
jgi:UDP-N-acetylglucosamine kinase